MIYEIVVVVGLYLLAFYLTRKKGYFWECQRCGTIVKAKTTELRDRGIQLHNKFLNCSGGKHD